MKKTLPKILLIAAGIVLIILLDQLTKAWAVRALKDAPDLVLIPGALVFRYLENTGMAFGFLKAFKHRELFFYIVTGVILVPVLVLVLKMQLKKRNLPIFIAFLMLAGGAVGNLIDRVRLHYVVDFIYFSLIDFPVFNVADIFVSLSCVLLFFLILFVYKDEELRQLLWPFGKKK
ncbi:MAG: signal peptidase II [Lachnospiraceae bacterium]|nr:signal peptidase II [Lachnospiraceae bacterium]